MISQSDLLKSAMKIDENINTKSSTQKKETPKKKKAKKKVTEKAE